MKDLIQGMVGALLISLIPGAIWWAAAYFERKAEHKQDHSMAVILNALETYFLDKANRG